MTAPVGLPHRGVARSRPSHCSPSSSYRYCPSRRSAGMDCACGCTSSWQGRRDYELVPVSRLAVTPAAFPVSGGHSSVPEGQSACRFARPGPSPGREEEDAFTDACTRCGACVTACPEGIVKPGDGGFPEIDLRISECTFCRACADACKASAFDLTSTPWSLTVRVTDACLSVQATFCRSCGDACAERAITFPPARGGVSVPRIDASTCTGCGACVSACPVGAVVPARSSSTSSFPETT